MAHRHRVLLEAAADGIEMRKADGMQRASYTAEKSDELRRLIDYVAICPLGRPDDLANETEAQIGRSGM